MIDRNVNEMPEILMAGFLGVAGLLMVALFVVVVATGPIPNTRYFVLMSDLLLSEEELKPYTEDQVLSMIEVGDIICQKNQALGKNEPLFCWISEYWPTKHSIRWPLNH